MQLDMVMVEHDAYGKDTNAITLGQNAHQREPDQAVGGRIEADAPIRSNLVNVVIAPQAGFPRRSHATKIACLIRLHTGLSD